MAYHRVLAIGYIYTFERTGRLEEREFKEAESYKTKKECRGSPELLALLHSLKINFGQAYADMPELTLFLGKHGAFSEEFGLKGSAYIYLRSFPAFIDSVIVLIILEPKDLSTDELIDLQSRGSFKIDGLEVDEFLNKLLGDSRSRQKEVYSSLFLRESFKPDDRELYGIIESDPGYREVSMNVVKEVVSKNASMIEGVDLFYSQNGMCVIFYDEPLSKYEAVTDLSLQEFLDRASEEFRECRGPLREVDPHLPLFIDYLVEAEPLRLQHLLLSLYEVKMKVGRKTKSEMAKLKAELTEVLDFYYAIASTIYKGVKRALIIGEREMGIGDLKQIFDQKIKLLSESIEMYHDLEVERWNMLFTYTLAAMGFASLLLAFLIAFFKREGPLNIAILLIISSMLFISLAGYLFTNLIKRNE